jgi:indoleamine 2,3-dioxygenase
VLRGFLPPADPCRSLPPGFSAWDELGVELPRLLAAGRFRDQLRRLPMLDPEALEEPHHLDRAMLLLSFFGSAAVWQDWRDQIHPTIPACVAVPWAVVANRLRRPPALCYASHALGNWRRLDPEGPIALGNLAVLQNFLGGMDEDWFILVHVALEAAAAPIVAAGLRAQEAARRGDLAAVRAGLSAIAGCLEDMVRVLLRMPERCDPAIFFHRIQPFLRGFERDPVVYEGVEALANRPQSFVGASAAQGALIPFLDAVLGIAHEADSLRAYLVELRRYMPPHHLEVLRRAEAGPPLREQVLGCRTNQPELVGLHDACVVQLERFRSAHLELTAVYITAQLRASCPEARGTGGTPFVPYLKKHRDETTRARTSPR